LRMRKADVIDLPVREAYERMEAALDPRLEDRSLTDDVERAAKMLDELA
jgi:histidine ammonia-lyase